MRGEDEPAHRLFGLSTKLASMGDYLDGVHKTLSDYIWFVSRMHGREWDDSKSPSWWSWKRSVNVQLGDPCKTNWVWIDIASSERPRCVHRCAIGRDGTFMIRTLLRHKSALKSTSSIPLHPNPVDISHCCILYILCSILRRITRLIPVDNLDIAPELISFPSHYWSGTWMIDPIYRVVPGSCGCLHFLRPNSISLIQQQ